MRRYAVGVAGFRINRSRPRTPSYYTPRCRNRDQPGDEDTTGTSAHAVAPGFRFKPRGLYIEAPKSADERMIAPKSKGCSGI